MGQPYFYIIEEIATGMLYAGSRWANNAEPSELLQEGGYLTSSKIIQGKIMAHGAGHFRIRTIRTFDTPDQAYRYESRFLKRIDAAGHPSFYNRHNNDDITAPFGLSDSKQRMFDRYGVSYYSQTNEFRQRFNRTCRHRYGVNNPMQSSDIQNKSRETLRRRYGVEHYSQTEDYRFKYCNTSEERYGVSHPMQSSVIRQRQQNTIKERYGVDNAFQLSYVQERSRVSTHEKYGVDKYLQLESVRQENSRKASQRNRTQQMCEFCSKVCNWGNYKRHHGINCKHNPDRRQPKTFTCPHCEKTSTNKGNMQRYHFDNCKHKASY